MKCDSNNIVTELNFTLYQHVNCWKYWEFRPIISPIEFIQSLQVHGNQKASYFGYFDIATFPVSLKRISIVENDFDTNESIQKYMI